MFRTPITACVITLNEERCIGACIESLEFCDEIIVVDAHSTDRTRDIAAGCGARVVERDWSGYRTQTQFAVSLAANNWIISIDADERLSPELAKEILRVRQHGLDQYAGYEIPSLASYLGHAMRHGDWYPDCRLRLFNRRRSSIRSEDYYEKVVAHGPVGRLRGHILHDCCSELDCQLARPGRSARLMADDLSAHGGHTSTLGIFLRPAWQFFRTYILRQGYLDGWRGFALAQIEANYVWEKYLRLYIAERAPRLLSNGTAPRE